MEKTAEEFIEQYLRGDRVHDDIDRVVDEDNAIEAMIEFAKLHVETALKNASEGQIEKDLYMMREYGESMDWKSSILNSYPLEKIK